MRKIASIITILISFSNFILGGGIHIYPNSLTFNNQPSLKSFLAGEQITMEFTYDNYAYGGKPYQYAVFILYEMNGSNKSGPGKYFVTRITKGTYRGRVTFVLGKPNIKYGISYYDLPYYDNDLIILNTYFLEAGDLGRVLGYYMKPENSNHQTELVQIETNNEIMNTLDTNDIVLYFYNYSKILENINQNKALKFRWYIGSESNKMAKDVKFSYRLDPVEDWSIFNQEDSAIYYFLRPGDYTFQVKAKYNIGNQMHESSIASYSIRVKDLIFQVKDEIGMQKTGKLPDGFLKTEHYNKSKALIIGVAEYDDTKFNDLPFVKNDINLISSTFKNKFNFEVDVLDKKTTKLEIEKKLDNLYSNSEKNDRVILYFSGHGASIGEAGFLVPSDGKSNNKVNTCISFDYISKWVDKIIADKGIKHLLIILDACQSGLGVYSKSSNEVPIIEISKYMGAHMLTAGLLNQEAIAENNNSIFTKYLVEGICGLADYNGDGIVTLSELLVYVQNNVSDYAKTKYGVTQTPMLGKIKGSGEMMFIQKGN